MVGLRVGRLGNGLQVCLVQRRRTPVVALAVLYRVGSQEETPQQAGLAHLVEHLAFGSSAFLGRQEFDGYCTDAGGTNNAMTTYSYTLYTMVLPAYQLPVGLWLEASRMRGLRFTAEEFATQQSVILEELKETVYNQPYGRWRDVQAQHAFAEGCPYHWEVHGSLESVAGLTVEQAWAFVRQYYRPDNAIVVVSGDIEPDAAWQQVEEYFGEIPAGELPVVRPEFHPGCRRGAQLGIVEDVAPVPAVFLSFHCGGYTAPEFLAVQLLADVLGGGRSSRLYRTLLLRRGIASEVGAFVDARQWSSLLTCYGLAVSPATPWERLRDELWQQLEAVRHEGIEEAELQTVRRRLQTAVAAFLQHPLGIAEEVALGLAFWNDPERPFRLVELYEAVTVEEVVEAARAVLVPERSVTTVVVPRQG